MAECLKCGAEKDEARIDCPQCGAIYAKVEETRAAQVLKAQLASRVAAQQAQTQRAVATAAAVDEHERGARLTIGGVIEAVAWSIVLFGCIEAVFQMYQVVSAKEISAPQQAAASAIAIAYVAIPYVFARTVQAFRGK